MNGEALRVQGWSTEWPTFIVDRPAYVVCKLFQTHLNEETLRVQGWATEQSTFIMDRLVWICGRAKRSDTT